MLKIQFIFIPKLAPLLPFLLMVSPPLVTRAEDEDVRRGFNAHPPKSSQTLMILEWRHCPPHLTDEDIEALTGLGICPRTHGGTAVI